MSSLHHISHYCVAIDHVCICNDHVRSYVCTSASNGVWPCFVLDQPEPNLSHTFQFRIILRVESIICDTTDIPSDYTMQIPHVCRDRRESDWGDGRPTLAKLFTPRACLVLLIACPLNLFINGTVVIYVITPLFFLLALLINVFNRLTRRRDFHGATDENVAVGWVLRRYKMDEMRLPDKFDFAVVHER